MSRRILVLEPDPMRQVFFRAALSSAGHPCRTVSAPEEAAEQVGAERFGMVLLGPEVDSAVAATLRQHENAPPVVKLSILPDCVIGEQVQAGSGQALRELPGVLEALTRYVRFAPPLDAGKGRDEDALLRDWSEFERRSAD